VKKLEKEGVERVLTAKQVMEQIEQGIRHFAWVTIEGDLVLSTKEGPKRIYVSPEMAQSVHFAAPTVPLVVTKKKQ